MLPGEQPASKTLNTAKGGKHTTTGRSERVLITGANGFIGSNLCRYFLDRSYEVIALVRSSSNLRFLEGLPVRLVRADLAERDVLELPSPIDHVIHAASLASESMSWAEAKRHIVDTTAHLLRSLDGQRAGVKRFIYISSALVLGHRCTAISDERPGRPARGNMSYGRGKRMAEALLQQEFRDRGLPLVILRPSDVFGPNDRTSSLRLLSEIEKGWPSVVGSGNRLMSFCYVDNLCAACLLACRMQGRDGAAYTVTNGQDLTWRRLMDHFRSRLGRPQRLFVPFPAAYALAGSMQLLHALAPGLRLPLASIYPVTKLGRDTTYDISRTRDELGYHPEQDVERQIDAVVRWYQAEKAAGRIAELRRR
jgi:nucleoside-diphosphate-sugar epimerase